MSRFQVGEVAVVSYSSIPTLPVGTEVTILRVSCEACPGSGELHFFQYLIKQEGINGFWSCDHCLTKKRPPGEEPAKWADCVWQPKRELVDG